LERRIRAVNAWPDTNQAHQSVAVIARSVLTSLTVVQTFESECDEFELTQYQVSFKVVDEL
jgi:hypothetical protein